MLLYARRERRRREIRSVEDFEGPFFLNFFDAIERFLPHTHRSDPRRSERDFEIFRSLEALLGVKKKKKKNTGETTKRETHTQQKTMRAMLLAFKAR